MVKEAGKFAMDDSGKAREVRQRVSDNKDANKRYRKTTENLRSPVIHGSRAKFQN